MFSLKIQNICIKLACCLFCASTIIINLSESVTHIQWCLPIHISVCVVVFSFSRSTGCGRRGRRLSTRNTWATDQGTQFSSVVRVEAHGKAGRRASRKPMRWETGESECPRKNRVLCFEMFIIFFKKTGRPICRALCSYLMYLPPPPPPGASRAAPSESTRLQHSDPITSMPWASLLCLFCVYLSTATPNYLLFSLTFHRLLLSFHLKLSGLHLQEWRLSGLHVKASTVLSVLSLYYSMPGFCVRISFSCSRLITQHFYVVLSSSEWNW